MNSEKIKFALFNIRFLLPFIKIFQIEFLMFKNSLEKLLNK